MVGSDVSLLPYSGQAESHQEWMHIGTNLVRQQVKGDPNLDLTAHWSQQQPLDSQAHSGILWIVLCAESGAGLDPWVPSNQRGFSGSLKDMFSRLLVFFQHGGFAIQLYLFCLLLALCQPKSTMYAHLTSIQQQIMCFRYDWLYLQESLHSKQPFKSQR